MNASLVMDYSILLKYYAAYLDDTIFEVQSKSFPLSLTDSNII